MLAQDIAIKSILESEGNKEDEDDKYNQVDLLCENAAGEVIIIELQFFPEMDYFHRILYGISKVITEYMSENDKYEEVKKVYSVNIVYFNLGHGIDYIYHGKMEFRGMHKGDELKLSQYQQNKFGKEYPSGIYPEIYIIKVSNFDDIAKDPLDEWIYFFKHTKLPEDYKALGLNEVEQKLKYDNMDTATKKQYDHYLKNVRVSESMLDTAKYEGEQTGIKKGKIEGKIEIILKSFDAGLDIDLIVLITSMSRAEVVDVLREHGRMD